MYLITMQIVINDLCSKDDCWILDLGRFFDNIALDEKQREWEL